MINKMKKELRLKSDSKKAVEINSTFKLIPSSNYYAITLTVVKVIAWGVGGRSEDKSGFRDTLT